ncbi:MAG: glycosyltransferase family 4 protein [Actinomycetia bacterium]|nr:glycosyltransferase family 4 protein [Actinomycetes bacterium]
MRVLLDCRMSSWSGVGRYTRSLARALARRSDIDLVQLVRRGDEPPADAPTLRATGSPLSPWGASSFGAAVAAVRPHVTHCAHFPTPFPVDYPLVVTLHDVSPLMVPGVMPNALKRGVYRSMTKRAVRFADRIITPSEHTAADIARLFPASTGKTTVVPLAADDFASGPVGTLPGWLAGTPYVFSMGNTKPHKDIPTLLRAFASIASEHPSVMLVLAGVDPGGYVRSVLGDTDVAHRVRFTGALDDSTLRALYVNASAFVFPSAYEGFGLPPLEAMALGTPVVCSDAASLPEVVGCAALSFAAGDIQALADALRLILTDGSVRDRLAGAGRGRAALFSWDRTAELTVSVYEQAVGCR